MLQKHKKQRGGSMSDYDFRQLNDKEFEIFCTDILSKEYEHRIERFKPGRDLGIDGRYFSTSGHEVILQCKHWSNTPIGSLIRTLETIEKTKLDKLKPKKYLLAVSNGLSRLDKNKIFNVLSPHINSESDIYGKEDLNDLLKKHPEVEKYHYKLWLHSTTVLSHIFNSALIGRSRFSLEEIIESSKLYAITTNHESALKIIEKFGVVIISGEPGVGKTTLANHLCLKYITDGFEYYKISDEIKEAEAAFNLKSKQIFYFDDFLGRNYLDALRGHEGSQVTQFIRRVSSDRNKRLVLTSRSTILNQGKFLIDSFEHENIKKNEFELKIKSLSDIDKARILYNHIFHSGMNNAHIEQLYLNKRYRTIISHRNFNPRLINYITDPTRLDTCSSEVYWQYVSASLSNPAQIWDNPFQVQLDDYGRALVLLVVIHGYAINETQLAEAYQHYISLPSMQGIKGRREFITSLRLLTGSFLNRTISPAGDPMIDLFNPSIGDYVLNRYSHDVVSIQTVMQCLRTTMSLLTLAGLKTGNHISIAQALLICNSLLNHAYSEKFHGFTISYISKLLHTCIDSVGHLATNQQKIFTAIQHIITNAIYGEVSYDTYYSLHWALKLKLIPSKTILNFIKEHYEQSNSDDEIRVISNMLNISGECDESKEVKELIRIHIVNIASDNLTDFVDTDRAFSRVNYDDIGGASHELTKLIEEKANTLGITLSGLDILNIMDSYDVSHELYMYYTQCYSHEGEYHVDSPVVLVTDGIDDLFERNQIS